MKKILIPSAVAAAFLVLAPATLAYVPPYVWYSSGYPAQYSSMYPGAQQYSYPMYTAPQPFYQTMPIQQPYGYYQPYQPVDQVRLLTQGNLNFVSQFQVVPNPQTLYRYYTYPRYNY